ncbi:hypothetical protein Tco_0822165 [Tanacetum coccineum]|uniref:RNA-directed DNA polymerase, eukaryota, reverse transcriptase zinc-binding domain protein n=1 Tax=Tanacetum coccineum TaxID=301880 RepID=A0ABQ5AE89_9ASTR
MEVLNLMVKRQIMRDKRFSYHSRCQKLKISNLFSADDLLMLCHGDMVSASILRRGLDEFSMSYGLYPSMNKSNVFFCNIPTDVKEEIKLVMPFREGVLPIRYLGVPLVSKRVTKNDCRVLMKVYWCYLFILPIIVCDDIDSLLCNFLWSIKSSSGSMEIELNRGMSWCWKHLLNLREKIMEFVYVKLGNGKSYSLWFDKWHPRGPLSKLIDVRMIGLAGLSTNAKVIDMIDNNSWN